jgi:hypothetical protein
MKVYWILDALSIPSLLPVSERKLREPEIMRGTNFDKKTSSIDIF